MTKEIKDNQDVLRQKRINKIVFQTYNTLLKDAVSKIQHYAQFKQTEYLHIIPEITFRTVRVFNFSECTFYIADHLNSLGYYATIVKPMVLHIRWDHIVNPKMFEDIRRKTLLDLNAENEITELKKRIRTLEKDNYEKTVEANRPLPKPSHKIKMSKSEKKRLEKIQEDKKYDILFDM